MTMVKLVCLSRGQHHHFEPLYQRFTVVEVAEWEPQVLASHEDADVLLTPSCDWYEAVACLRWAQERSIPTLYVMDGIIEWRHEWENPAHGAGGGIPFNQPLLANKAACLGFGSARTLEGWGNVGKCEIVGAPRFDHYLDHPVPAPPAGPRRLLVMTANTPGFTADQVAMVTRSLADLKAALAERPDWTPIWRLRGGLNEKLGFVDDFPALRRAPLRDVLAEVHAVVSTPSTALVEGMLANRPVASLDYSNSPTYVSSGWNITCPDQLRPTLASLGSPPLKRLSFQQEVLHNTLECYSPALPRLERLVETLADLGRRARSEGRPLTLPPSILPLGHPNLPPPDFDFQRLYEGHPVFGKREVLDLQLDLVFARQENVSLKRALKKSQGTAWLRRLWHTLSGPRG